MTASKNLPNVEALKLQMSEAEQAFNRAVESARTTVQFYNGWKSRLNEHQFRDKLAAAKGDPDRQQRITAEQDRLRCSYISARLAMDDTFERLSACRHKLQLKIVEAYRTSLATANVFDRDVLQSLCLSVMHRLRQAYDDIARRYEKERERDLTVGEGERCILGAYARLAGGGLSGMEVMDPTCWTQRDMCFVRLNEGPRSCDEQYFAGARDNNFLVSLAEEAEQVLKTPSDEDRTNWNQYFSRKAGLNERQYAERMRQTLSDGRNPDHIAAAVGVIKNQQQYARIDYMQLRLAVSERMTRLKKLSMQLRLVIDKVKKALLDAQAPDLHQRLVVMNNVIAAMALVHMIGLVNDKWTSEMADTQDDAQRAEASLGEELRRLMGEAPYNSLYEERVPLA